MLVVLASHQSSAPGPYLFNSKSKYEVRVQEWSCKLFSGELGVGVSLVSSPHRINYRDSLAYHERLAGYMVKPNTLGVVSVEAN